MRKFRISDPQTFHLRKRILDLADVDYRECGSWLELEARLESLPENKRRMVEAALRCHFNWREMQGLNAKEKVAIGVAAMDVDAFRQKRIPV